MSPKAEAKLNSAATLLQVIGAATAVAGFLIGFYVSVQVRFHDLETHRQLDDQDRAEMKADLKVINDQLEAIKLELKDKADRQDSK